MPSRSSGNSDIVSGDTDEQVDREVDQVTEGVGSGLIDLRAEESDTGVMTDGDGDGSVVALGLPFS